ncbi:putative disease resistance protein At3g14460 [Telopea speciosissima]|uniref:putative disease resistance protein At3g14460 n=1 Tax=Telopea speciosissima TaxID=54955 RepID=UPI001CC53B69|nr:putative disease resistance protein At3g14460 [Telopea speciosissima]
MALQVDPLSAAATLLTVAYLPDIVHCFKSKLGLSSSDDAKLHTLSWNIANIEQILDEVEYDQLLDSSALAKIRRLRYASYRAEDELDEILIARSEKLGQPTQSSYNQVFSFFSSSETITPESLGIKSSARMMNEVMPSISDPARSSILNSRSPSSSIDSSWSIYKKLPAPLKKCFVLFSIFTRNHKFEKENLVQLWMGEDFIRDDGQNKKLEDIGSSYFDKLLESSFFLLNSDDIYQLKGDFHELAKFVSCGECLTINESEAVADYLSRLTDCLRHFSLHCENYLVNTADVLAGCEGLRTFLLHIGGKRSIHHKVKLPYNQFTCFKRLRVLDISCSSTIEVPDSIGCLKHLRYLDLSKSIIEKLPKTICKLRSLQILKLNGCKKLKNLPCLEDLRSLKKLLLDKNHYLDSLPPGIGQLTMLETFSCPFVLEDAKEAALNDKQFLCQLKLKWTEEPTGQYYRFEEVLEGLQRHSNLETLKILGYGGWSFPDRMTNDSSSFGKLKKVSLRNCKRCQYLPPLWRLPMLKTLSISEMDQIEQLNNDSFLGSGSGIGFSSLEMLKVKNMPNLKIWLVEQNGNSDWLPFPNLNRLMFKDCPMLEELKVLHMLNSLCFLKIKECPLLTGWMDQQPGWQKKQEDDGSLMYQRI